MGFLDEVRKKNKIAKSLVSNGLAPSFDVAVKMAEARMRVESGAQEPIETAQANTLASTTVAGLKNSVIGQSSSQRAQEKSMTLEEQKRASIMMYRPKQEEPVQRFTPVQPPVQTRPQEEIQTEKEDNEGNNMNTQEFERIMAENTKFITEQMIDFKSQLAAISASVEMLKQDLSVVKQDVLEVRTRPRPEGSSSQASSTSNEGADGVNKPHTDSSGGQHFVIHPPESEHHETHKENPRGDPEKINPDDVSIEKMFNFSHKKF